MDMIRNLFLVLAGIGFVVVIGGAVYEHLALVPVWVFGGAGSAFGVSGGV